MSKVSKKILKENHINVYAKNLSNFINVRKLVRNGRTGNDLSTIFSFMPTAVMR